MLEKELGNCYIDKLWPVFLLEVDFKWLLNLFYAWKLMHRMNRNVMISIELIACQGNAAIDGVMYTQLFLDDNNILHPMWHSPASMPQTATMPLITLFTASPFSPWEYHCMQ